MGLKIPALRYLAREHARRPFTGRVLTLGRQCVYATLEDVHDVLKTEGLEPRPLARAADRYTNMPRWTAGREATFTSDKAFWSALAGLSVETLDISGDEHPDHLVDLNGPLPEHLAGRFDLILDDGTLEHVFDTRQALHNVVNMLSVGGRVIHMSPASNCFEHGFYQFSPTLFFDYYGVNGFEDLRCTVADIPDGDVAYNEWYFRDWDPRRPDEIRSAHYLLVLFRAEKGQSSTAHRIPQQGCYRAETQRRARQSASNELAEPPSSAGPSACAGSAASEAVTAEFAFEGNFCWIVRPLPPEWLTEPPDTMENPVRSRLVVTENGRPLEAAHAPHQLIRSLGGGRFSHWADTVRFASSDNSNPLTNGRVYELAVGDRRVRLRPAPTDPRSVEAIDQALSQRRAHAHDVDAWFRHDTRFSWSLDVDALCRHHAVHNPGQASVSVLEDGRELSRTMAGAGHVREQGGGSFWVDWPHVMFSASDNTNPKLNGRVYEVVLGAVRMVVPKPPQALVLGPAEPVAAPDVVELVCASVQKGMLRPPDIPYPLDYYCFMTGLMRHTGCRRVLEIGTGHGYSAAAMATAMAEAIDVLVTCDFVDAAPILNDRPRVHRILGDVMGAGNVRRILELFGGNPIDVLFVDSGHDYETTIAHMSTFATLLRPKVILIDDIVLNEDMARFWSDVRALYGDRAVNACAIDPRVRVCECGFGVIVPQPLLPGAASRPLPGADDTADAMGEGAATGAGKAA